MEMGTDDFSIDPGSIDIELCRMAPLLMKYFEEEARLRLVMESKEGELERWKADLDDVIRTKLEKATEARVKAETVKDDRTQKLKMEVLEAALLHNVANARVKALLAKKDCLIALAYRDRQLMRLDAQ